MDVESYVSNLGLKLVVFSESNKFCKKLKFGKTIFNSGKGEPKCCETYICWSKQFFIFFNFKLD